MGKHTVFMDWKTQYSKDVNCTHTDRFNSIPIKIAAKLLVDVDDSKNYVEKYRS